MNRSVLVCLAILSLNTMTIAKERDEDLLLHLEKYVVSSKETVGNFSTISFRNWKSEVGKTTVPWTQEELARYALDAFERKHPTLEILSFSLVFASKSGGGIECTGVLIYHKPRVSAVLPS